MDELSSSVEYVHKKFERLSSTEKAVEWFKCKSNPFYFIFNYAFIPEIGGIIKYEDPIMGSKIRRFVRSVAKYHKCLLMASRQLGKALSVYTPISIPGGGYKLLGFLKVGDYVLGDNFEPTMIVAVTNIELERQCYKINFSTGEYIIADTQHLWRISHDSLIINNELKTTKEINDIEKKSPGCRINDLIYIKSISPIPSTPVKCIQVENKDGMYLCGKTNIPTHNSTIAGCLLEWACNFYPCVPATILNANKSFALENLEKIKFIHGNLPSSLRTPLKYKGDRKTTMEYTHGSIIR